MTVGRAKPGRVGQSEPDEALDELRLVSRLATNRPKGVRREVSVIVSSVRYESRMNRVQVSEARTLGSISKRGEVGITSASQKDDGYRGSGPHLDGGEGPFAIPPILSLDIALHWNQGV